MLSFSFPPPPQKMLEVIDSMYNSYINYLHVIILKT